MTPKTVREHAEAADVAEQLEYLLASDWEPTSWLEALNNATENPEHMSVKAIVESALFVPYAAAMLMDVKTREFSGFPFTKEEELEVEREVRDRIGTALSRLQDLQAALAANEDKDNETRDPTSHARERCAAVWESIPRDARMGMATIAVRYLGPAIQRLVDDHAVTLEKMNLTKNQAQVGAWWLVQQAALRAAGACSVGRGETLAEFLTAAKDAREGLHVRFSKEDDGAGDVHTEIPLETYN